MSDSLAKVRPTRSVSLEGLLGQVALGSREAFTALYRDTSQQMFGVCLRVLADRSEAEDALQEAFTAVWRKAAQFDASRASASAWLAMIARNKALDRLRARPARKRLAPIELSEEIEDPQPSPQQQAQTLADRSRLDSCLQQLEPRRRSLICAAFFEGSTYEELASRAGSPLGSVKSWIRRGLMQLRACLQQL
ncbi:MAG TPA: sigma-70 family RNA polymerase sigma factor [Steroidobacteraceae bacterium]|nr:sigma-70 family RNA polymerase sigma factor [Steroidobacteraceae bacterium]